MAESDFNLGPNFPPGGAPENPKVNTSATDTEAKKAQQAQTENIKALTETLKGLKEQYEKLNSADKAMSEEESANSKKLQDKIQALSLVLEKLNSDTEKASPAAPLSNIAAKEKSETFTRITKVITDFQRSSSELKASGGGELNFDQWFASYLEQQRTNIQTLSNQETNNLLLNDIKKTLKESNTSLANLSEQEIEELTKKSIKLSVERKERELELLNLNREIIKNNRDTAYEELKKLKELVEVSKSDPSKATTKDAAKSISKQIKDLSEGLKSVGKGASGFKFLGPFADIATFLSRLLLGPLLLVVGLLVGSIGIQYKKLKSLGDTLSTIQFGRLFDTIVNGFKRFKDILLFVYKDFPLIAADYISSLGMWISKAVEPVGFLSKFFQKIARGAESLGYFWMKVLYTLEQLPTNFVNLMKSVFQGIHQSLGEVKWFGTFYMSLVDGVKGLMGFIGSFSSKLGYVFEGVGKFGGYIMDMVKYVGELGASILTPVMNFFSSGITKAFGLLDKVGGGLTSFFNLGKTIGEFAGPLVSIIEVIMDLPKFFKGVFSGNVQTMVKSIMALIVQIAGYALATIFGGPLGSMAASFALRFDNIMKWFDPIFDFVIDLGGTIWKLVSSLFVDVLQPLFEMLSQFVMTVLNIAFFLLKPIFKVGQFILKLLSPIIDLIILVFKGLGYVFKGLTWLFKAIDQNIVQPFVKFSEWFVNKFIQPIYDWLASTFIGKMLGMETKEKRLARERQEKIDKMKAEGGEATPAESPTPSVEGFSSTESSGFGMSETKDVASQAIGVSATMVEKTTNSMKSVSEDFSGSIYSLIETLKTHLLSVTGLLAPIANALGVASGGAFARLSQPELTKPMPMVLGSNRLGGAATLTPISTPNEMQMAQDYQAMYAALKNTSAEPTERAAASNITNQNTTVVNNTSGGPSIVMPSNNERTVNAINSSVRPAG